MDKAPIPLFVTSKHKQQRFIYPVASLSAPPQRRIAQMLRRENCLYCVRHCFFQIISWLVRHTVRTKHCLRDKRSLHACCANTQKLCPQNGLMDWNHPTPHQWHHEWNLLPPHEHFFSCDAEQQGVTTLRPRSTRTHTHTSCEISSFQCCLQSKNKIFATNV